jgi:hypothetical protein
MRVTEEMDDRVLLLRDNFCGRKVKPSHRAVIRVYDSAGNVIETHAHKGEFREVVKLGLPSCRLLTDTSLYGGRNRRQIAV